MKKILFSILFACIAYTINATVTPACSLPQGSYLTYCKGCKCQNNEIRCDTCAGEWGQTHQPTSIPRDKCTSHEEVTVSDTGNLMCNPR